MKQISLTVIAVAVLVMSDVTGALHAQDDDPGVLFEYGTWALMQTVPSPVFVYDGNESASRLQFAMRWNISPLNYSFNSNPLVSPVQFFKVNPVRRYGGSAELTVMPEWAAGPFRYSDQGRFVLSAGLRCYIPAIEHGEYLAFSFGGKYRFYNNKSGGQDGSYSAELGTYTLWGTLGFQFSYNFSSQSKYDFGVWLKYY
ncbi:MAG: hypothetical protein K1X85_03215 [Ignavibacteria bacterium]|nr:hypothetical protein [Ignavibacteria bacterium]